MRLSREKVKGLLLIIIVLSLFVGLTYGGVMWASDDLESIELTLGTADSLGGLFGEGTYGKGFIGDTGLGALSPGDYTGGYAVVPDGRVYISIPLMYTNRDEIDVVFNGIRVGGVDHEIPEESMQLINDKLDEGDEAYKYKLYLLFRDVDGSYVIDKDIVVEYLDRGKGEASEITLVKDGRISWDSESSSNSVEVLLADMLGMSQVVSAGDVKKYEEVFGGFDFDGEDSRLYSPESAAKNADYLEELINLGEVVREEYEFLNSETCDILDTEGGISGAFYEKYGSKLGHSYRVSVLKGSNDSIESRKLQSCTEYGDLSDKLSDISCADLQLELEKLGELEDKASNNEKVSLFKPEREDIKNKYKLKLEEYIDHDKEIEKELNKLMDQMDDLLLDTDNFGSVIYDEYSGILGDYKIQYEKVKCADIFEVDYVAKYNEYRIKGAQAREACSTKEFGVLKGLLEDNTHKDMSKYVEAMGRLESEESKDRLLPEDSASLIPLKSEALERVSKGLEDYGVMYTTKSDELYEYAGCLSRAVYEDEVEPKLVELIELSKEVRSFDMDNILKYMYHFSVYNEHEDEVAELVAEFKGEFEDCSREYFTEKKNELDNLTCNADLGAFESEVSSRDRSLTLEDLSKLKELISKKTLECEIEEDERVLGGLVDDATCDSDFESIKSLIKSSKVSVSLKGEFLDKLTSKEKACKIDELERELESKVDGIDCDSDLDSLYLEIDDSDIREGKKEELKQLVHDKKDSCELADLEDDFRARVSRVTCSDGYDYIEELKSEITSSSISVELKVELIAQLKEKEKTCKIQDREDELRDKVSRVTCDTVSSLISEVSGSDIREDAKSEMLSSLVEKENICILEELGKIEDDLRDKISNLTCASDFDSIKEDINTSKLGIDLKTELELEVDNKIESCILEELGKIEDELRDRISNLTCASDFDSIKEDINTSKLGVDLKTELVLEVDSKLEACKLEELEDIEDSFKGDIGNLTCSSDFESLKSRIGSSILSESKKLELLGLVSEKENHCELSEIEEYLRDKVDSIGCPGDYAGLVLEVETSKLGDNIKGELLELLDFKEKACDLELDELESDLRDRVRSVSCGDSFDDLRSDIESSNLGVDIKGELLEELNIKEKTCVLLDKAEEFKRDIEDLECSGDFNSLRDDIESSELGSEVKHALLSKLGAKETACKIVELEDLENTLRSEIESLTCGSDFVVIQNKVGSSELDLETKSELIDLILGVKQSCVESELSELERDIRDRLSKLTCGSDMSGLMSEIESSKLSDLIKVELLDELNSKVEACEVEEIEEGIKDSISKLTCGSDFSRLKSYIEESIISSELKSKYLGEVARKERLCISEELSKVEDDLRDRVSKLTCGRSFVEMEKDIKSSKLDDELKLELLSLVESKKAQCKLDELENDFKNKVSNLKCGDDYRKLKFDIEASNLAELIKSDLLLLIEEAEGVCKLSEDSLRDKVSLFECGGDSEKLIDEIESSILSISDKKDLLLKLRAKLESCDIESELEGSLGRIKDKYKLDKDTESRLKEEIEKDIYVDGVEVHVVRDLDGTYTVTLSKGDKSLSKSGVVVELEESLGDTDKDEGIKDNDKDQVDSKDDDVTEDDLELGNVEDDKTLVDKVMDLPKTGESLSYVYIGLFVIILGYVLSRRVR